MRRTFLRVACWSALSCGSFVSAAQSAPGIALRWSHCFGEGTGAIVRSFACDTNAGLEQLIGSFIPSADMADVSGNEIVVDLYASNGPPWPYPTSGPIPEWWRFRTPGTCRQNALSMSTTADPGNQVCRDWSEGQATGGIGAYVLDPYGTGTARIIMASAVPRTSLATLQSGQEYFSFELRIRHDKTVGAGACSGCDVAMFIVFNSLKITTTLPENDRTLVGPLNGVDSDLALWRPGVVATRTTTWRAVKRLYR